MKSDCAASQSNDQQRSNLVRFEPASETDHLIREKYGSGPLPNQKDFLYGDICYPISLHITGLYSGNKIRGRQVYRAFWIGDGDRSALIVLMMAR